MLTERRFRCTIDSDEQYKQRENIMTSAGYGEERRAGWALADAQLVIIWPSAVAQSIIPGASIHGS